MYAIIENGGKQYKAVEGDYIDIDLLPDEVGKKKTFDKVLLLSTDGSTEVGEPYLKGVSVDTMVVSHFKGPKIIVFKYRAKQRYRVKTGHRQKHSRVLVESIAFPGKSGGAKKSEGTVTSKKTTIKPKAEVKKPASAKVKTAAKKTTIKPKAEVKKPASAKVKTAAKKTTKKKATADEKTTSADKK